MKNFLLKVSISIGLVLYILNYSDYNLFSINIETILNIKFFTFFIFGFFCITLITSYRAFLVFRKVKIDNFTFRQFFIMSSVGQFYSLFGGGGITTDIYRTIQIKKQTSELKLVIKSIFFDRLFGLAGAGLLTLIIFTEIYFQLQYYLTFISIFIIFFLSRIIFLSIFSHIIKIALVYYLAISYFNIPIVNLYHLSLSLVMESMPISWQGLGFGHIVFENNIENYGYKIYSYYLIGKIIFKLFIGGGFYLFITSGEKFEKSK